MNIKKVARAEPVISAGAVVTAIVAVITVLNTFSITHISGAQVEAINAAIIAMWPLLLVIRQVVWSPASVERLRGGE